MVNTLKFNNGDQMPMLGLGTWKSGPGDVYKAVKEAIASAQIATSFAEVTFLAQNHVQLEEKAAEQALKLVELLDDHDDIQKVHSNFDISDEIMEKMAAAG